MGLGLTETSFIKRLKSMITQKKHNIKYIYIYVYIYLKHETILEIESTMNTNLILHIAQL